MSRSPGNLSRGELGRVLGYAFPVSGRPLGYRAVQVLEFVRLTIEAEGSPPSYRMIAHELNLEKGNVCRIVGDLERRGLLARAGKGRVRRIRLTA